MKLIFLLLTIAENTWAKVGVAKVALLLSEAEMIKKNGGVGAWGALRCLSFKKGLRILKGMKARDSFRGKFRGLN